MENSTEGTQPRIFSKTYSYLLTSPDDGRLSTGDDRDIDQPEGSSPDSSQIDKIKSAIFDNEPEDVENLLKENKALVRVEFDFTFNEDDSDESWTSQGMTPLAFAARLGHIEICRILLNYGADVAAKTKSNRTNMFWLAVLNEYTDIADLLFEEAEKANVNILELRSIQGDTALIRFAFLGELSLVEYLLRKGAAIQAKEDGSEDTALHNAAMEDHYEVVEMLLNLKEAPEIRELKNKSGQTPLLTAAQFGKSQIASLLLDKGADYNIIDNDGNTALHYAAISGDRELAERLLALKQMVSDSPNEPNATSAVKSSRLLNMTNKNEDTPLALALSSEQEAVFAFLLESGAKTDIESHNGDTLLHRAAKTGQLNIVKKLLPASIEGAESVKAEPVRNILGETPMMLAAQEDKFDVVEYLLSRNETFTEKGMKLEKAMFSAAHDGHIRLIQGLWGNPHLREIRDSSERTPLLIASQYGHAEIVEHLCQNGANFEAKDDVGDTPIGNAIYRSSASMVKCLLNHGADQTATNEVGRNVLHFVSYLDDPSEFVQILLADSLERLGKALSAEDCNGDTPLCDACRNASPSGEFVVFQLLGSKVYFPGNPTEDRPHQSPAVERDLVRDWLKNWTQERRVLRDKQKERGVRERKKRERGEEETQVEQSRLENGDAKSTSSKKLKQNNHTLNTSLDTKEDEANAKDNQAELKDNRTREDSKRIKSVIYWAILNNDKELVNLAMIEGGSPTLENEQEQKGATWLHVAALSNSPEVISSIDDWEKLIQRKTEKGVTPLHVAARMGHQLVLRKLLRKLAELDEDKRLETLQEGRASEVLSAIIHETEDNENLISLAAAKQEEDKLNAKHLKQKCQRKIFKETERTQDVGGSTHHSETSRKHLELEKGKSGHDEGLLFELWQTVIAEINATLAWKTSECSSFPYGLDAEYIVKSAASVYTIMDEDQLQVFEIKGLIAGASGQETGSGKASNSSSNFLMWTAKHDFPLAFCWLLSSGEYFGEAHIEDCEKAMRSGLAREQSSVSVEKQPNRRGIIESLLRNQPPVRQCKDDTQDPSFLSSVPYSETRTGTVIDISRAQGQIYHNFNLKRAQIFEFIYDGPQKLMASNETYDCQAVIKNLFPTKSGTETSQAQDDSKKKKVLNPSSKETDRAGIRSTQKKVRWLHLPVNDVSFPLPQSGRSILVPSRICL